MGELEAISTGVEALIDRARDLDDDDRLALARARAAIDETFHAGAWKAAVAIAAERAETYLDARLRVAASSVPDRLDELVGLGSKADLAERSRWQDVARLAQLAVDDALLALVAADRIRPPDLRELYGPWRAMLDAAHARRSGGSTPGDEDLST